MRTRQSSPPLSCSGLSRRMPGGIILILALLLISRVAFADTLRIELIGGTIATRANGDVVLELDIASDRMARMGRYWGPNPDTWGQLRPRAAFILGVFQRGLSLNVNGRERPPTSVELSGLAAGPDQAPLPKFIPVIVTWRQVGLLHAALAPNLVTATFHMPKTDGVQLLLEENMPWWQVLARSIVLGFEHIVPAGLDHILFVLGIYLAATRFRDLFWQVTAFTIAHSITLGLTVGGVIVVGQWWEQFVEIGIAISIATVAFENCLLRRPPGWRRIFIVGGFGLIHGMGFAGRLSQVKWPGGTFFLSLFGANLGIELGQLAVICAAALVSAWWWKCAWYQSRVAMPISLLIGLYGMFAALDRISEVSLSRKDALNMFWDLYDHHYWSVPFVIGAATLAILWAMYRLGTAIYRYSRPRLMYIRDDLERAQ